MSAHDWLTALAVGMVAGAIGQLVRAIVGLSKRMESGETKTFEASRLVVSVLVGATAGALAAVATSDQLMAAKVSAETMLGLMAAGYAGTDFIEGMTGRLTSKLKSVPPPPPAPAPPSPPAPTPADPTTP